MDIIDDDKASELPRPRAAGTMDPVVETEKHELTSIWMQNGKTENQTFGLGPQSAGEFCSEPIWILAANMKLLQTRAHAEWDKLSSLQRDTRLDRYRIEIANKMANKYVDI